MVVMRSVFTCLNCAINLFVNLFMLYSNLFGHKAYSHQKKKSKCHTNSQKIDRQYVKNYRPVSFLKISCSIFDRIIFNTMYPHFFKKQDQTENQLGFQLSKYCVNQLLVSTHEIFLNFDDTVQSYRDIPWHFKSLLNPLSINFSSAPVSKLKDFRIVSPGKF